MIKQVKGSKRVHLTILDWGYAKRPGEIYDLRDLPENKLTAES
jgi:hypothetical protein